MDITIEEARAFMGDLPTETMTEIMHALDLKIREYAMMGDLTGMRTAHKAAYAICVYRGYLTEKQASMILARAEERITMRTAEFDQRHARLSSLGEQVVEGNLKLLELDERQAEAQAQLQVARGHYQAAQARHQDAKFALARRIVLRRRYWRGVLGFIKKPLRS